MYFLISIDKRFLGLSTFWFIWPNRNSFLVGKYSRPVLVIYWKESFRNLLILGQDQKRCEINSSEFLQYSHRGVTLCTKWLTMQLVWREFRTIWYCNHFKPLSIVRLEYNFLDLSQKSTENLHCNSACHFSSLSEILLLKDCFKLNNLL